MNKRVNSLIVTGVTFVGVCVVSVLVLGMLGVLQLPSFLSWMVLQHQQPGETDTTTVTTVTTTPEEAAPVVIDKTKNAKGEKVSSPVIRVDIQNARDTYAVITRADNTMAVEAYQDILPDTTALTAMCENLSYMTAVAETTANEDDSAYGLSPAKATVTATYFDGMTATVLIGDKSKGTEGYYCRLQGNDTLYIIDAAVAESFLQDGMQWIGKTLIAPPAADKDDESGQAQLLNLWLTGTCRDRAIELITDVNAEYPGMTYVSSYVLRAPYLRAVDSDYLTTVTPNMAHLTASGVAAVHPTLEQLDAFGLSDPYSVAAFTLSVVSTTAADNGGTQTSHYNDREHMILLGGKNENGDYYALIDQYDIVYTLSPSSVPWAEMQYIDVTSKLLFMKAITSVERVTVTENGDRKAFELVHRPDESERDDQLAVTADGRSYNTPDFRVLYQLMIGIKRVAEKEDGAAATGEPVMTLKMEFNDGTAPMEASFYPMSGSRYLCVMGDGEEVAVSIKTVDDFLKQYHNYLNGDPVTSIY